MSENINGETFPVSHGGVSLPFEWIVAGKTNYSNPDLLFDDWKDKKDHRYARIFLKNTSDAAWSDTIIIVNHKPSASEEEDKQAALFIECYLQRKFNLFNS